MQEEPELNLVSAGVAVNNPTEVTHSFYFIDAWASQEVQSNEDGELRVKTP